MKGGGKNKGKDNGKDKGKCKGKNKGDGKGKPNDGKGKVGGVGHPPQRRRLGRSPLRVRSASSGCTRCGCALRLVRPARARRRVC